MKLNKINKNIKSGSVAALALVIGTFAWQSFSQMALNESSHMHDYDVKVGARLRDDYDGSNKDVYVENYSDVEDGTLAYARIRLDEYFEYGEGAGTLDAKDVSILRGDIPNAEEPLFSDSKTWDTYAWGSEPDDEVESIRTYRDLSFAGKTVYMPTFNKNYNSLESDINGTYAGLDGDRTTDYDRYADYQTYEIGDESEATAVEVADPEDESGYMMQPATVHKAQATLNSQVISMQDWKDAEEPIGNYWVYDDEGWAYWAAPIEPQTATGLLLDEILVTEDYDGEWYYAVNVIAQVASAGDWGDEPEEGVTPGSGMYEYGLSGDGRYLLDLISAADDDVETEPEEPTEPEVEITVSVSAQDGVTIMSLSPTTYTLQMSVEVTGTENEEVSWYIHEEGSDIEADLEGVIDQDGLLTANDTMSGGTFRITAVSKENTSIDDYIDISVAHGDIILSGDETVDIGSSVAITSIVRGLIDDALIWSIEKKSGECVEEPTISTTGEFTPVSGMGGCVYTITAEAYSNDRVYEKIDVTVSEGAVSLDADISSLTLSYDTYTVSLTPGVTGMTEDGVTYSVEEIVPTGSSASGYNKDANDILNDISSIIVDDKFIATDVMTGCSYKIVATSVVDTSKSASVTIAIKSAGLVLTRGATSVNAGGSTLFTATVSGYRDTQVDWLLEGTTPVHSDTKVAQDDFTIDSGITIANLSASESETKDNTITVTAISNAKGTLTKMQTVSVIAHWKDQVEEAEIGTTDTVIIDGSSIAKVNSSLHE